MSIDQKIGYTRREFQQIFQVYANGVFEGLFKDFSFSDTKDRYFISFSADAGQNPLITIEKQKISADKALFIATTPAPKGTLRQVARSEKIGHFIEQLKQAIALIKLENKSKKPEKRPEKGR
ncbi:MAG: DUF2794 domain-containing protein [Bdellovibrionales bacterium]